MDVVSLWLPILVSSVVVFFASFLAWMVLPHHKADWAKLTDEDAYFEALKSLSIAPGQYMFPHTCDPAEMKSEEFKKKLSAGPRGTLNVWPRAPNMGANLICTFCFYLAVAICVGYVGTLGLKPGAEFVDVFRLTGTVAILAHAAGHIPDSIWFKRKVRNDLLDGIVFGLLTGVVFGLLWPAAAELPTGGALPGVGG